MRPRLPQKARNAKKRRRPRRKNEIQAFEAVFAQRSYDQIFVKRENRFSRVFRRSEQSEFPDGKVAVFEYFYEFAADKPRRPDDAYRIFIVYHVLFIRFRYVFSEKSAL